MRVVISLAILLAATLLPSRLLGRTPSSSSPQPFPPFLDDIAKQGCKVQWLPTPGAKKGVGWWRALIWADSNAGDHWERSYSLRDPEERDASIKDCGKWLNKLDSAVKKVLRKQSHGNSK